jgi:hypothetical protein
LTAMLGLSAADFLSDIARGPGIDAMDRAAAVGPVPIPLCAGGKPGTIATGLAEDRAAFLALPGRSRPCSYSA